MTNTQPQTGQDATPTQVDIEAAFEQANKGYQSHFDYEMDLRKAFARHRIATRPTAPATDELADRTESLGDALFVLSGKMRVHGFFENAENHTAYEQVVSEFKTLRQSPPAPSENCLMCKGTSGVQTYYDGDLESSTPCPSCTQPPQIDADDLAYIEANTPLEQYVEFVNTRIDNNGRWFTRTSRAAVAMTDYYTTVKEFEDKVGEPVIYHNPPLPITGYWVNERSDCFVICGPDGTIPGVYFTPEDATQVCGLLNENVINK